MTSLSKINLVFIKFDLYLTLWKYVTVLAFHYLALSILIKVITFLADSHLTSWTSCGQNCASYTLVLLVIYHTVVLAVL